MRGFATASINSSPSGQGGNMKTFIGSIGFYPTGTNPYDQHTENPYRIGRLRAEALAQFRDTGKLPDGFSLWNDLDRKDVQSPDEIDWRHMRS